jgi:hypothetical protein
MANKVLLKKSSTAAKVPTTSDLDYGELALNYTDGKLYYKTASNTINYLDSITTTATLTNKTLTSPVISGGTINNTVIGGTTAAAITGTTITSTTGDISSGNALVSTASAGDEGGEIRLAKATTNTTINTSVTIDIYQNKLRIFETGGTNRGAYIDITAATAGVGSNLLSGGGGGTGTVTSITAGTGLSGGTITGSGTIALATAYGDTTNPYASKTANYVLAAPNGSAGVPTFRALVAADIPTPTISVSNYNTAGTISGTITGVTTLRFDNDTGVFVSDLGSGAVKVRLASSFKTWKVTGQTDLVAVGEDTIQLVAGSGVSLTTDPSASPYKTLTIAATGGSGATFTTSSTAPTSPAAGDRWLHSTTGVLYTYVNDGDSSQWVDLGDGAGGGSGGTSTDTLHPFLLMGA